MFDYKFEMINLLETKKKHFGCCFGEWIWQLPFSFQQSIMVGEDHMFL